MSNPMENLVHLVHPSSSKGKVLECPLTSFGPMSNPIENLVHLVHPSSSKEVLECPLISSGPMSNPVENLVHLVHPSSAIAKDSRVPSNLLQAYVKSN